MARQRGIINLEGRVGNLSFYKTSDGFVVRTSTGVSGERVKNDPSFQRTRENGYEFGRASKASKLLRAALQAQLVNIADARVASRLTRDLLKIIQSDSTNNRGARTVPAGDISLLLNFQFNFTASFTQTFNAPFNAAINREIGTGTIIFEPFIPKIMIAAPQGATHYRILSGIVAPDFAKQTFVNALHSNELHELSSEQLQLQPLQISLPSGHKNLPIFLTLGIEFSQVIHGKEYPLQNSTKNAMAVVAVSGASDWDD
jgi:hypothetical protein